MTRHQMTFQNLNPYIFDIFTELCEAYFSSI